jgi:hypothetical protein
MGRAAAVVVSPLIHRYHRRHHLRNEFHSSTPCPPLVYVVPSGLWWLKATQHPSLFLAYHTSHGQFGGNRTRPMYCYDAPPGCICDAFTAACTYVTLPSEDDRGQQPAAGCIYNSAGDRRSQVARTYVYGAPASRLQRARWRRAVFAKSQAYALGIRHPPLCLRLAVVSPWAAATT